MRVFKVYIYLFRRCLDNLKIINFNQFVIDNYYIRPRVSLHYALKLSPSKSSYLRPILNYLNTFRHEEQLFLKIRFAGLRFRELLVLFFIKY